MRETETDGWVELRCGARVSERAVPYHLIPACAIRRIAKRFAAGQRYTDEKERYKLAGMQNWQKGDEEFFVERLNHGVEHLIRWIDGDRSEDHLAAVGWMVCALMWAEEKGIIR